MKRVVSVPRADWTSRLEEVGVSYHTSGKPPEGPELGLWWDETVRWELSAREVDVVEDATNELHRLCLDAVNRIVREEPTVLTDDFGFPQWMADYVVRSWLRGDPALMGRMDLAYTGGEGPVKLLEYNADTPTLVIETAVAQWQWLETVAPEADQFNMLHENLIEVFGNLKLRMNEQPMHFMAFRTSAEEWSHATYFRDLAEQAGIRTFQIDIPAVRWDTASRRFLDEPGVPIAFLHKLYPWEWTVTDEFGPFLAQDTLGIVEPPWKAVLSHKAILPALWKYNSGHPLLLEAHIGSVPDGKRGNWVEKPMLGREGANVKIIRDGVTVSETQGSYGNGRMIYQALAELPVQDGWTTVIGSWIAGNRASGLIFREVQGSIVSAMGRVVPHLFR